VSEVKEAHFAIQILTKLKSIWNHFGSTTMKVIGCDQEWRAGVLVQAYKFKVRKPTFSKSASEEPIALGIPDNINVAEFNLHLPEIAIASMDIRASNLPISARELIGPYLKRIHNEEEIPCELRLQCPVKEVIKIEESTKENGKIVVIENPNSFPVRSCDICHQLYVDRPIKEIVIKRGTQEVLDKRLIRIRKEYALDFSGEQTSAFFTQGIVVSDESWLKHVRTESRCELRFTFDLEPHEKVSICLYYDKLEDAKDKAC